MGFDHLCELSLCLADASCISGVQSGVWTTRTKMRALESGVWTTCTNANFVPFFLGSRALRCLHSCFCKTFLCRSLIHEGRGEVSVLRYRNAIQLAIMAFKVFQSMKVAHPLGLLMHPLLQSEYRMQSQPAEALRQQVAASLE
jgi:hypothetical protein